METIPEEQTITKTVNPSTHVKNPKRVAQGKKLAEISKAAKQKKKQEHEQMEVQADPQESNPIPFSLSTSLAIIGTFTGLVSTYIAYKRWTKPKAKTIPPTPVEEKTLKNLDKFSL